jgi:hypothetical protein
MKAEDAKKIADNFNRPEIDKYLNEIYSKEKALEEIKEAAKEGFYSFIIYFESFKLDNRNPIITDNNQKLIIEDFIFYFEKLNYQIELGFTKGYKSEKATDAPGTIEYYYQYPYLLVSWKKWAI